MLAEMIQARRLADERERVWRRRERRAAAAIFLAECALALVLVVLG